MSHNCEKFVVFKKGHSKYKEEVWLTDLKKMEYVGFSGSTADATKEVKSVSDFICKTKGGRGALREFVDLILSANGFI